MVGIEWPRPGCGGMSALSAPPRPFKLGFLTHVHGDDPPPRLYQGIVELFVAAEELGFDSGWVAQHHFQPRFGRLPSPFVLLAAAAARTRTIRLGTGVVVLGLEDPIRLAEDAAVLDALSGGRLDLGVGTGGANTMAFGAFGRDVTQRRELAADTLDRLQFALAGGTLDDSGTTLQPPAPSLGSRLWDSTTQLDGVRRAAREGRGLLLGVGHARTVQRPLAEAYLEAWAGAPEDAPIAAVRGVFPDDDIASARAELAPDIALYDPLFAADGHDPASLSLERKLDLMNVHHGPVDHIVETLASDPTFSGVATHLLVACHAESSSIARGLERLEAVARQIAPALGWSPVGNLVSAS
jgi:alkanesulfonate monooxygenase SsuD/methylene tetrahydromethanopterin reductase-like flavin-dependent oxidoreductase (luciferase family)